MWKAGQKTDAVLRSLWGSWSLWRRVLMNVIWSPDKWTQDMAYMLARLPTFQVWLVQLQFQLYDWCLLSSNQFGPFVILNSLKNFECHLLELEPDWSLVETWAWFFHLWFWYHIQRQNPCHMSRANLCCDQAGSSWVVGSGELWAQPWAQLWAQLPVISMNGTESRTSELRGRHCNCSSILEVPAWSWCCHSAAQAYTTGV